MKFNISFMAGIVHLVLMTSFAYSVVGEAPSCEDTFPWHFPITVFITFGLPFLLGYFAKVE